MKLSHAQFTAVVGPSGAGKTSLLRLVLGLVRPTRGAVRIAGQASGEPAAPRVGYVPQLETVDWNFPVTVEEVVLMGRVRTAGPLPWTRRDDRTRVRDVLDYLQIGHLARSHIRALSGGQQQRVFLARALVSDPDLLVLDEPTTGVDLRTAESVLHLLGTLNSEGKTVLMTTHDLNAVAAHVPWAVCLNRRLVAEGAPGDVFTEDILTETYGGEMLVLMHEGMLFVHRKPHTSAHGHPANGFTAMAS